MGSYQDNILINKTYEHIWKGVTFACGKTSRLCCTQTNERQPEQDKLVRMKLTHTQVLVAGKL